LFSISLFLQLNGTDEDDSRSAPLGFYGAKIAIENWLVLSPGDAGVIAD